MLCLISLNFANVVRFPREIERHGFGFIIPYLVILLFIGTPIVVLEMALGQFLGQASAYTWKTSPLFKGASVIGRLGAVLKCVWITMQSSLVVLYVVQLLTSQVPFSQCPSTVFRNVRT